MKHLFAFFISFLFSFQLFAQASITSMTVYPANPTTDDMVEVRVEIQTPSSDCPVDWMDHTITDTIIAAASHHCSGQLAAICNNTDTFELGMLPAGDYLFDMTFTNGFGGPGCSPGFVIDDMEQLQFTVTQPVGIRTLELNEDLVYPNPVVDVLNFKRPLNETAIITNTNGKQVAEIVKGSKDVDLSVLPKGVYVLHRKDVKLKLVKIN